MKNLIKTGLLALTVLSLASCVFGDKAKKPIDATNNISIDTTQKDTNKIKPGTAKLDTVKK